MSNLNRICVYCGSNSGASAGYATAAVKLAQEIVKHNIELVYGGASVGLMGVLANTMLDLGGTVIGVIPKSIVEKEVAHDNLSQLIQVDSMHERKSTMESLADGFIAMPGGFGTIEEMFEMLTWAQLGFHKKPCGLLNTENFFASLVVFLKHAEDQQFVKPAHRAMLLMEAEPDRLLQKMLEYEPIVETKWIGRDAT